MDEATMTKLEAPADPGPPAGVDEVADAESARPFAGRSGFLALVREHHDRLYGYCVHLCGDRTDAEDLLQDTLLRAMRSYGELHDPESARAWLFTIATNCARDRWRACRRTLDTVPFDTDGQDNEFSLFATITIEDPFPYSDELHLDFLRLFDDADLQAVFVEMTPVFRAPLLLTTVHGFSCKEAAAILGLPLGTLLSRIHRGRKQLERGLWEYAVRHRLVTVSDES